jgi:hypothetical protein
MLKILKKDKKGELTTTQLVTIIILIVSFVIILFLIFRLDIGGTTDDEICRNSVVLKGKSIGVSGPLDCKTNYLCISGGEDCSGIISSEKISVDADNKTQIMKVIAEEMASCWYMFGEGKINYGEGFLTTKVHYALCSVIAFDESISEKIPSILYSEFYDYLQKTNKTTSQKYLQYLYSTNNVNEIKDGEYFKFDITESIDTSQSYSVFTGIDMNVKILFIGNDDRILNTFIIPTAETSSRLHGDREFITKA